MQPVRMVCKQPPRAMGKREPVFVDHLLISVVAPQLFTVTSGLMVHNSQFKLGFWLRVDKHYLVHVAY